MKIREIIIVEGRDDTRAIKRAVEATTIETHGFGISEETMKKIGKAYKDMGIIIFTDPDYAGEKIRKRLIQRFPKAKEAYLIREDAKKGDNIGIENASVENIVQALEKARVSWHEKVEVFSKEDMVKWNLVGSNQSKERRQRLGKLLGIGYGNCGGFLKKLNGFNISREEFEKAIEKL